MIEAFHPLGAVQGGEGTENRVIIRISVTLYTVLVIA